MYPSKEVRKLRKNFIIKEVEAIIATGKESSDSEEQMRYLKVLGKEFDVLKLLDQLEELEKSTKFKNTKNNYYRYVNND